MTFFCLGGLSGFVHGVRSRLESLRRAAPSHPRAAGLAIASLLAASASPALAQVEGYGKDATGGAGKPVCTVTSSAAEGPGTWDSCVSGGGNQIIQFAVPSATVRAVSYLRSNTTVDGCANGQNGVTLNLPADARRAVVIEGPASNVIVRCVRFQGSGPKKPGFSTENDLLALDGEGGLVSRVVIDRCTFVEATDGALDLTGSVSDVTVSFNLLYGTPLTQLIKYGTRQRLSIHHNVYTAGGERNPQIKGDARDVDFVSNAIYNQTVSSDGLGNGYSPYGTSLRNGGSGSDSPGNVKANLRANFYGGQNSGLEIVTDAGASAAAIYIAPDNVCAGGCISSPSATPNAVPAAYATTVTPVTCMASQMLPLVGSPNRTSTDQAKLAAVAAALPGGCGGGSNFTLTVAKAGTGAGTVTSTPAGISCGATCSASYASGTVVTLSQAATAGSVFAGWSGACTGTGACTVTMSAARSVTATFNLGPQTLTVAKAGTGVGTVTSTPAGINCGATCSASYASGTVVTLSKTAAAGSVFAGWSGSCTGTGTCSVTMSAARSVTATFNVVTPVLTVTKAGTGAGTVTSTPAGISCGATCSAPYASGTVVTLSQAATAGSVFAGWSGACTGTGACSVTMSAAKSVTATFNLLPQTLSVAKAGTGTGTVTSSPAGISCGATCSAPFASGTVVTLNKTAAAGSVFAGWSGSCTGTGACTVTMNSARSVTATFNLIPQTLTVVKAGTGTGTVTSTPAGINCGATCSAAYGSGTVVTLNKTAAAGSVFTGWSGACTGTGACTVTMSAAKSVTATFKLSQTLTVVKAGTGTGTVTSTPAGISCGATCSAPFASGAVVTLSKTAAAGSVFTGWSGACAGTGACSVTLSAAKSVTATFSLAQTLTVAKTGTGAGTVTSSPAGISCGATCSAPFASGKVVTLNKAAAAGSVFAGWSGACTGTGTCSVTMSAARSVTATFNLLPRKLTVVKAGTGVGTVTSTPAGITCGATCSASYASGTVVTLSQTAAAGSVFAGWSGACTGRGACAVTMSAAKSVTATFGPGPAISVSEAAVSVGEGDEGQQVVVLGVSLASPAVLPVKVAYASRNGTAVAGADYQPVSGTLVFPPGSSRAEFAIWVSGDVKTEAAEIFTVNLSAPENGTIANGTTTVTIVDNDTMPALTVADLHVTEGSVSSRNVNFQVMLSAVAPADVSVNWTTANLTAAAGTDYLPGSGTLVIRKGLRSGAIPVAVVGDAVDERNEAFLLSLSGAVGARIVDGRAQGVILDDDGAKDPDIPIASLPYVATRPGRYRLTGDLSFAPALGAAVTVASNGVVIDLDGRTLSGTAGAATETIGVIGRNRSNVTVQNGTIRGFLAAVYLAGPPPYTVASKFSVKNLKAQSNWYAGLWLEGLGNVVDACEVTGTGGTTALDPGAGAVGISSVGSSPTLTQNQVRDTVASTGGDAIGIAVDGVTGGVLSGNQVKNTLPAATASGILVTRAKGAAATSNTLDTLAYGIVYTLGANGTCQGNTVIAVTTPAMGVTCEP